jgi:hypothetical protein
MKNHGNYRILNYYWKEKAVNHVHGLVDRRCSQSTADRDRGAAWAHRSSRSGPLRWVGGHRELRKRGRSSRGSSSWARVGGALKEWGLQRWTEVVARVSRWGSVWSVEKGSCGADVLRWDQGTLFIGSESEEGRGPRREAVGGDAGAIQWRQLRIRKEKQRGGSPIWRRGSRASAGWHFVPRCSRAQEGEQVRRGGGGWSMVALGFNTEEGERSEWASWAKWPHGADEAGLVREERWTRLQVSLGRNRFGPPKK